MAVKTTKQVTCDRCSDEIKDREARGVMSFATSTWKDKRYSDAVVFNGADLCKSCCDSLAAWVKSKK